MKTRLFPVFTVLCGLLFCRCNMGGGSDSIPTDSATIARGEISFNKNCAGCHNFRQDGIGPQLSGITAAASASWINAFVHDPRKMMESGDERAHRLAMQFKTVMPAFSLSDEEMKGVLAFLNAHKQAATTLQKDTGNALSDPIPQAITASGLVVDVQEVTKFPATSDSGKMQLTRITQFAPQPGTGRPFVLDLRGRLYSLQNNRPQVYMDMIKLRPNFINEPGLATGFGSFAFHPKFASNGLLYTTHTEKHASTRKPDFGYADSIKVTLEWVLTEWKADNPAATTFSGSGRELFRVSMVSGIHGVQEIAFNPLAKPGGGDYGLLYIGVGDGGCVENGFPFLAHSRDKVWGSILRIDPAGRNSGNGQYGIPATNPFAGKPGLRGELYAYGFRNPHRLTWTHSGQLLACNIGQANIESVNLVLPGHDYGWPVREGNFLLNPAGEMKQVYALPANDSGGHFTYPVAEYDHGEGQAISGGYDYEGRAIPLLKGKFIFGDIPTGRLFYVNTNEIVPGKQATIHEWKLRMNGAERTLKELCGAGRVDLHFGEDAAGELYIMTKADGKLYKLTSASMQ